MGRAPKGCSPSGQRGVSQRPFPRRASVGPPSAVPSLLWLPPAPPCKPLPASRYQKASSAARAAGGQTSGGACGEDQMRTKTGPRRPQIVTRLCGSRHIDEGPCIQSYFREIAIATMVFLVEPHLLLCPHPSHSSCSVSWADIHKPVNSNPCSGHETGEAATQAPRRPFLSEGRPFAPGCLPPGRVPCRTLIHLSNKSDCAGLHALHSNTGARQGDLNRAPTLGWIPRLLSQGSIGALWCLIKAPDSP